MPSLTTIPSVPLGDADIIVRGKVSSDVVAISNWLQVFKGRRPHTYRAYLKEVKRWMAFLEMRYGSECDSYLKISSEQDVEAYLLALGRPPKDRLSNLYPFVALRVPESIVTKYGINGEPFGAEHSARSIGHSLAIVSAMYRFLSTSVDTRKDAYLSHNPTKRLVRMVDRASRKTDRHFTSDIYFELLETIRLDFEAAKTDRERLRFGRRRWIICLFYGLWVRLEEAEFLKMSSFSKPHGIWEVTVMGKGQKERTFEVTKGVIEELINYRKLNGLPPILASMEDLPAILQTAPKDWDIPYSHQSIFREVKIVAAKTATRLESEPLGARTDEELSQLVDRIRSISPHWFRHSGATEAINAEYPIRDAADRLGHTSIDTTSQMYYHGDSKRRVRLLEEIEANRLKSAPV